VEKKYVDVLFAGGLNKVYHSAEVCCPKNKTCSCSFENENGKEYEVENSGKVNVPEGIVSFTCIYF
jgi:putative transposon-encoded protein